jgi:hypothetical protein
MACKFLYANGAGYESDAVLAIDYAVDHGAEFFDLCFYIVMRENHARIDDRDDHLA